ncbi:FecR family protein [uncultured Deinococcus sp.]|uniref:FecR family protein n=1 Tax=uncultured Deinococcus sp. TaxID=158789 RepID=UPI002588CF15|nr:FecR family protein [uncultured Deinococcus sp.]
MSRPALTSPLIRVTLLVAGGVLVAAQAQSAPPLAAPAPRLSVQQASGRVEVLSGTTWQAQSAPALSTGLRTGTGRATLAWGTGRVVVGSASRLRVYSGEADLQEGQFLLQGPVAAFVLGRHLMIEGAGRARVDLTPGGSAQRLAVLKGAVRVSGVGRAFTVREGQQLSFTGGQITAFTERDPWYDAQFVGVGDARVEGLLGSVNLRRSDGTLRPAARQDDLGPGEALRTGAGAWAEIGFTGGGYLRLNEQSELGVLAVEKTSRGREVTLQLTRGVAWNVVEKGQGGYRLSTPVVSTSVRGTVFRVDADGLVKVFEGQVALPSSGDLALSGGEQKRRDQGAPSALQLDATDRLNQALDVQRARPLTLSAARPARHLKAIDLTVTATPQSTLSASVLDRRGRVTALGVTPGPAEGQFVVRGAPGLPEGEYLVRVRASRYGAVRVWSARVGLDRSPPQASGVQARTAGQLLEISGQASDNSGAALTLTATLGEGAQARTVTRRVEGRFRVLLPAPPAGTPLHLSLRDAAGNATDVPLP